MRSTLSTSVSAAALFMALFWHPGSSGAGSSAQLDTLYPPLQGLAALDELAHLERLAPAPACGADLVIMSALVDPSTVPDRSGEWLEVVSREPITVSLTDWHLVSGRRSLWLRAAGTIDPGEAVRIGAGGSIGLGSLRLKNTDGDVLLIDPCGTTRAALCWGGLDTENPAPGQVVRAPAATIREGPDRSMIGGTRGGCGQT